MRTITLEEVKQHTTKDAVWFVIHDKVYDVTKFMDEHPGGEEVLLDQAGKNASEIFEDVSHSADAKELMKKYEIGELPESERATKATQDKHEDKKTDLGHFDSSYHATSLSWTQWTIAIVVSIGVGLFVRYCAS